MIVQLEKENKSLQVELLACARLLQDSAKSGDHSRPMPGNYKIALLLVVVNPK